MDSLEFDSIIQKAMTGQPNWFSGLEAPVKEERVKKTEKILNFAFPTEYRHFVLTYGAGYFGKINISSPDLESEWYALRFDVPAPDAGKLFVVTDDECGGFYGFMVLDRQCDGAIYYLHPDDGNKLIRIASNFFTFVTNKALP